MNSSANFSKSKSDKIENDVLSSNYDVIVFSHLRWEFVLQRPQHIMNRISKDRKVLFVEEPAAYTAENRGSSNIIKDGNVTVLQPRIEWEHWVAELQPILKTQMQEMNITKPIIWFYSPMFIDILPELDYCLVVYDCMDELSAFKGAPKQLIENEKKLLRMADVSFTGGKSLYESKHKISDNVFCFPSSVDQKHFEKSLMQSTALPQDIASIKKPVVGFYGVIDERIDLPLLQQVAQKLPDVSFVMIGPIVKILDEELPKASNIHYLGPKSYSDLPHYLKGIDIAMMPFAMNESTRFISPTKTLEFMAAYKPIISTPIYDVVRDYRNEVAIVETADQFVEAVHNYINETNPDKNQRIQRQKDVLMKTSWDTTVCEMQKRMAEAVENRKNSDSKMLPVTNGYSK